MVTYEKFPYSTPELRDELKHTFWLLNRVDSAKALARKLKEHPIFNDYEIVLAAGDGKLSDDEENMKSYDKVRKAIDENEKTITLSVGQLTTGVTIPEWTAVMMLSSMKSLKSYDRVRKAIDENEKTITLSVGQLTTGVTIPEWTAVMMLSSMKSPAMYMQAAFR